MNPFSTGSVWLVFAAIVMVAIVYEQSTAWGGILLVIVVMGMLLVGNKRGTI